MRMIALFLLFTGLCTLTPPAYATGRPCAFEMEFIGLKAEPDFIKAGASSAFERLMERVEPLRDPENPEEGRHLGVVVAGDKPSSPDMHNYWFRWARDEGIVMTMLADIFNDSKSGRTKNRILRKFINFLEAKKILQDSPNPAGEPTVTYKDGHEVDQYYPNMSQAKGNLDLTPFTGDWAHNQSDGPAYSLKGILRVADILWNKWKTIFHDESPFQTSMRKSDLYDIHGKNGSVDEVNSLIKRHLNFSFHNWNKKTTEMWEMDFGHHFAVIGAHQAVLLFEGPAFARMAGDPGAAVAYENAGREIDKVLMKFWDGRIIRPSMDLETGKFIEDKPEGPFNGIDTAVIIGAMHMKSPIFTPASDYVLSTIYEHELAFKNEYAVNQEPGQKAVLIGRYLNDSYVGIHAELGTNKGNPWFLTTYYFAEHAFKTANELYAKGEIKVTDLNAKFFNYVLSNAEMKLQLQPGRVIRSTDPEFKAVLSALVKRGDAIFERLEQFRGPKGEMSEQIFRDAPGGGYEHQRSIRNLTWSYAAYFRALKARRNFVNQVAPGTVRL
jgi:hypothetical protein